MKRGLLVGLILGLVGIWGWAQCPEAGLPVLEVKSTVPGGYILLIQNNRDCAIASLRLVFRVEVAKVQAFAVPGPTVVSVKGEGRVWKIEFAGPGLPPNGYVVVGVAGATPAVEPTCEALVRYVFPYPPFCLMK